MCCPLPRHFFPVNAPLLESPSIVDSPSPSSQSPPPLDYLAFQWLLEDVDENDMDKFVAGLPALIRSPLITDATVTMGHLVEDGMLDHVRDHLTSCMSSREVSQTTSIGRAFACVEAMDATFSVLDQSINPEYIVRAANELVRSFDAFRAASPASISQITDSHAKQDTCEYML
jgi:uncharacterized protein (DUF2267 family)